MARLTWQVCLFSSLAISVGVWAAPERIVSTLVLTPLCETNPMPLAVTAITNLPTYQPTGLAACLIQLLLVFLTNLVLGSHVLVAGPILRLGLQDSDR